MAGFVLVGKDVLMGSKRRIYTPEYRREAARLVIDTGRPIAQVARELQLGEQLLGRWVRLERDRMGLAEASGLSESERVELDRLRQENAELRLDNEFLGKAAAFFAANQPGRNASR
jgi:transposase